MAIAPQYRLIDNRRSDTEVLSAVDGSIDALRKAFYTKVIEEIIRLSPVDTGTYMDSHNIQEGRNAAVGTNSSRGKPRRQQYEPYAGEAKARLLTQIEALSSDHKTVYIANDSVHAPLVEYGGAKMPTTYAPYTRARDATPRFIREALEETRI